MILGDSLRLAECARADLAAVGRDTLGLWDDDRRELFDREHMDSLLGGGRDLIAALRKAQEAYDRAERILS